MNETNNPRMRDVQLMAFAAANENNGNLHCSVNGMKALKKECQSLFQNTS